MRFWHGWVTEAQLILFWKVATRTSMFLTDIKLSYLRESGWRCNGAHHPTNYITQVVLENQVFNKPGSAAQHRLVSLYLRNFINRCDWWWKYRPRWFSSDSFVYSFYYERWWETSVMLSEQIQPYSKLLNFRRRIT